MSTKKRDIGVVKEKKGSPSQTTSTPLRGTLNQSANTKTKTSVSSPSQKQGPTSLIKPTTRSTAVTAPKQQLKKPAATTNTPQKPAVARTVKTVSPVQKTTARSSGKPVDSQKPVPGKNLKTPSKDAGKSRLLPATNASNVKKSSPEKKEVVEGGSSATKEHVTCILKVEISSVEEEAEVEAQNQESCIAGEETEKVDEKGTVDDLVVEDQEPLDTAKSEAKIEDTDVKIVFSEVSTASGHENTVPDVKRQDSDDKSEEDNNSQEDVREVEVEQVAKEDVREVEQVVKEEETEIDSKREAPEIKETERKEVVVQKKQEPAENNKAPQPVQRAHGKMDNALSNDVIEETASKLQEQRKNRVRALAGAFETVISLQDK